MATVRLNPRFPNSNICELKQSAIKTSFHQAIITYNSVTYTKLSLSHFCHKNIVKFFVTPSKNYLSIWGLPKHTELSSELCGP